MTKNPVPGPSERADHPESQCLRARVHSTSPRRFGLERIQGVAQLCCAALVLGFCYPVLGAVNGCWWPRAPRPPPHLILFPTHLILFPLTSTPRRQPCPIVGTLSVFAQGWSPSLAGRAASGPYQAAHQWLWMFRPGPSCRAFAAVCTARRCAIWWAPSRQSLGRDGVSKRRRRGTAKGWRGMGGLRCRLQAPAFCAPGCRACRSSSSPSPTDTSTRPHMYAGGGDGRWRDPGGT